MQACPFGPLPEGPCLAGQGSCARARAQVRRRCARVHAAREYAKRGGGEDARSDAARPDHDGEAAPVMARLRGSCSFDAASKVGYLHAHDSDGDDRVERAVPSPFPSTSESPLWGAGTVSSCQPA